ncbi:MAG TPA: NAD(P)H-dependent glycerol-3-phosphate dehydrogenase [Candidatus Binataceae bacterium]|nr:NAD(P)H-dependent glycerol-3-phosphate dehydrogenase [Candidatus Binataceae bacterium]
MNDVSIAVLGAGAWGTALAILLARAGRRVTLCVRRPEHLKAIRSARENAAYLPGVEIAHDINLSSDWTASVAQAGVVVMTVPSRHARGAIVPIAAGIRRDALLVSATKGLEPGTLLTMTAMLREAVPGISGTAVLSGPGFAAEVARGKPAALVAASSDEAVARRARDLFAGRSIRVYSSIDVVGVEIAGAAKNVIAIAAGASDGLDLGASARAAVITRGLAEMMRLAAAAGGRRETIAGLSGLGDLVLTCTGDLSRNRAAGLALGRGNPPATDDTTAGRPIAEGISNAQTVRELAHRIGAEMPIVEAVYRALYEAQPAHTMVEELLSRELKAEF